MRVLGIETSCDETGIAIYDDEKGLLANQLYSQVKLHADYGGVVPELASRDHVRKTVPLIQAALKESGLTAKDIDAVAYTAGPGLVGALLVGATVGRSLAFACEIAPPGSCLFLLLLLRVSRIQIKIINTTNILRSTRLSISKCVSQLQLVFSIPCYPLPFLLLNIMSYNK